MKAILVPFLTCLFASSVARADGLPAVPMKFQGVVTLIDDVNVPAKERGVLVSLAGEEGSHLTAGQEVAQIDDAQARSAHALSVLEHRAAELRASDDSPERLASATIEAAKLEERLNLEANVRVPGTKSLVEMQRLSLATQQALMQYEHACHQTTIADAEAQIALARATIEADSIARRRLVSPFAGEIAAVLVRVGEWVEPGTPVVRVIRLDRMRVEGFISTADRSAQDLRGAAALITIRESDSKESILEGRVSYVSPVVQAGKECKIYVEFENRMLGDQWACYPGQDAEVSIGGAHAGRP